MSAMSNYLEDQLVKHLFRTGSFTKPTVIAVALCTSAPTDSDISLDVCSPACSVGAEVRLSFHRLLDSFSP